MLFRRTQALFLKMRSFVTSKAPKLKAHRFNAPVSVSQATNPHSFHSAYTKMTKFGKMPSYSLQQRVQTTSTCLMVPPNKWLDQCNQKPELETIFINGLKQATLGQIELEFYNLYHALKENDINIIAANPCSDETPFCIFPSNWIQVHDKRAVIFPLKIPNRRLEIRHDILALLKNNKFIDEIDDSMTNFAEEKQFCEGNRSLVLDRQSKVAFIALSSKTSSIVSSKFALDYGYQTILFESKDIENNTIDYTGCMMSIGNNWVVICLESIKTKESRNIVKGAIEISGKVLIEITLKQQQDFCASIIELGNNTLCMSERAYNSFTKEQIDIFTEELELEIIKPNIDNIEDVFKGSVRCMLTEIF